MKYNVEFENGYVKSFVKDENGAFEFDATKLKLEYLNCYKASGTTLILDEDKYQRVLEQEEAERQKPTQMETIEAQVLYTALMTDTMLEE